MPPNGIIKYCRQNNKKENPNFWMIQPRKILYAACNFLLRKVSFDTPLFDNFFVFVDNFHEKCVDPLNFAQVFNGKLVFCAWENFLTPALI